jgi:hypothetical protein
MMSIITTLLQPIVFLIVLLIELYKAVVPTGGVSMSDTVKSARGMVQEVRKSAETLTEEFKDTEETPKKDI